MERLPAALGRLVRARSVGHVVVLDATGSLSDVVEDLDCAARYALAEGPRGVVCDLSRVDEASASGALQDLALNGRHPRDWPGVPLAIAGLGRRDRETLSREPLGGHLMVGTSLRQALSSVFQASLPGIESLRLAPHPTSPRASRDFVSRTLLDWRLARHIPAACLVVSELVTNSMIHAGTAIDVTVSEHRQAVRLAIRDGVPGLPVEQPAGSDQARAGDGHRGRHVQSVGSAPARRRRQGCLGRHRPLGSGHRPTSVTHPVTDMGGLRCVYDVDDVQLDA